MLEGLRGEDSIAELSRKEGIAQNLTQASRFAGRATCAPAISRSQTNGKETDRLTGGIFKGASNVEIHEMKMDGDKMTMRELNDGIEIKPGATVTFNPGSYHLMFLGLKTSIAKGPNDKGSLTFEKAGDIDVALVADLQARTPDGCMIDLRDRTGIPEVLEIRRQRDAILDLRDVVEFQDGFMRRGKLSIR